MRGGLVGQVLCFPYHLGVILPCKETESDVMLNYFCISNLVKCTVKLGVANVGMSSAVYNKTKSLQLMFMFVIVKKASQSNTSDSSGAVHLWKSWIKMEIHIGEIAPRTRLKGEEDPFPQYFGTC